MFPGMNFIGGKFLAANGKTFNTIDPVTEEVIGKFPLSEGNTVYYATVVAEKAFLHWKRTSRIYRADLFHRLCRLIEMDKAQIAHIISVETGKNYNEALAEVIEGLHMCQYVAAQGRQPCGEWMASEIASKDAYVLRKPKGVVAVISPWNFPLAIGSFWTTGPALLEGNTVVHKPSELTPYTAQYMAQLYLEAGFPEGVYNIVHGDGSVGANLVKMDRVKCILFTGSAEVGQKIRQECANRFDRNCSTETGSKSATILLEDGNQDLALEVMIASAFKLSGQRCVSSGRLLIERSIFQEFVDKFIAKASELAVGGPFESPAPYFGPLISAKQRDRVERFNKLASLMGVKVLLEGKRLDRKGFFLTPHVYTCDWWGPQENRVFLAEEVFGPHVALIPFDGIDGAISVYNDTDFGLALGVITDDFRKMRIMRDECNAGMIYFNGGSIGAESHFPFGGVGKSGNSYKSAAGTYRAVTDEVAVTVNYDTAIQWAQGMK
jgi:aldehyde dehydrogenase (NAD+)